MMPSCTGRGKTARGLLQLILVIFFWSARNNSFGLFRGRRTATVNAVVVGGILLPHGDFALDPTFFANGTIEGEAANEVATGARNAGRWLMELVRQKQSKDEPTIVLLMTPHGIKLDYDYGIYISSKGSGTATIGGDCTSFCGIHDTKKRLGQRSANHCQHKPYNVTLENIDLAPTPLATDLLALLRQEKNHPVSGVYSYSDETPIPLNWGEIVPLLLLPPSATTSKNSRLLPLIWTFPYRRYNHSVEMVPELLQIGADIMEWAQQRPEKIAIIVSGDLSHTHQPSGPYGYSAASALFDEAIGVWAGGNTNIREQFDRSWDPCQPEAAHALLNRAKELQPDAKSCGFTGYVLWHGMMCSPTLTNGSHAATARHHRTSSMGHGSSAVQRFDSKVFVNRNVTYYGMMGAVFEAKASSDDRSSRVENGMEKESYGVLEVA